MKHRIHRYLFSGLPWPLVRTEAIRGDMIKMVGRLLGLRHTS
jgi:hypothetical protein